ncbi:MAG: hypothetical protein C0404_09405 [Verrucomicrobia bacterium]|nr:hypothetical protein [Verrucomicrobiota bacterium]
MKLGEYQKMASKLDKIGNGVRYLAGDEAAGKKAVENLKAMKIEGESPSYSGISAQRYAAMYDWLHDHPDLDAESRKKMIAHMENWADGFMGSLKAGGPCTPFYSRVSGAIAGLTTIGLALHGDSPKAEEYVRYAAQHLRNNMGRIREIEDGAQGGGSYSYHHEFTDLANMVAAWRSATDWDAGKWIKENQGNWLERQLLFQIWNTYPNGWFVKDGDIWDNSHTDKTQLRMQVDAVTSVYRNGFGRTWADEMYKRWGTGVYHGEYAWEYFIFNDPEVKPRPLEELGRAEVFSPKMHGIVCWRDSWKPDATIIHFRAGENCDHHGTQDAGKFTIFKTAPLAIKDGYYSGGYKKSKHLYYKSAWSANVVVFDAPSNHGNQPGIPDIDKWSSLEDWKAQRDRIVKRPLFGILEKSEVNDKLARAVSDLTGSCPDGSSWKRELVFLDYRYLLVLDRVKPANDTEVRWTLHTINDPKIDGQMLTADNGNARLFCKTLLPDDAKLSKVGDFHHKDKGGKDITFPGMNGKPEQMLGGWRLDVTGQYPKAECVFLHVLLPTTTATDKMPECSVKKDNGSLTVKVGDLEYRFPAGN